MAEVLGYQSIVDLALPSGVDGAKIAQWQLQDGMSYQAFIGEVASAFDLVNTDLRSRWGGMFALTEQPYLMYPDGGAVTEMPEITDVDFPDSVHGTIIGHMIDLKDYGRAIGGSWKFFRRAIMPEITSSIRTIKDQGIWRFEKALLTRLFSNLENGVGVGYDVPFVRGTGGNIDYTPPAYAGQTFATSHDHFLALDSDTQDHGVMLEQLAATVEEHGHTAPFSAIVARADVSSYFALSNFIKMTDPRIVVIDRGGATSGPDYFQRGQPQVSSGVFGHYQSTLGEIELRASYRVPTNYAALYKSYGELDARNPLKVRVDPTSGFGFYLVTETTNNDQFPIKRVVVAMEFGVSVGEDRTNGAAAFRQSTPGWLNPTIS